MNIKIIIYKQKLKAKLRYCFHSIKIKFKLNVYKLKFQLNIH